MICQNPLNSRTLRRDWKDTTHIAFAQFIHCNKIRAEFADTAVRKVDAFKNIIVNVDVDVRGKRARACNLFACFFNTSILQN